jgi:hypothetical protein
MTTDWRSNTLKKAPVIVALGVGLLLSGCSAPGPAAEYTGPAVIKDAYKTSRKTGCKLVVTLPDGQTDTVRVGRRTTCDGYNEGQEVQLRDGDLVR